MKILVSTDNTIAIILYGYVSLDEHNAFIE